MPTLTFSTVSDEEDEEGLPLIDFYLYLILELKRLKLELGCYLYFNGLMKKIDGLICYCLIMK
jgi:hypothetical protein